MTLDIVAILDIASNNTQNADSENTRVSKRQQIDLAPPTFSFPKTEIKFQKSTFNNRWTSLKSRLQKSAK